MVQLAKHWPSGTLSTSTIQSIQSGFVYIEERKEKVMIPIRLFFVVGTKTKLISSFSRPFMTFQYEKCQFIERLREILFIGTFVCLHFVRKSRLIRISAITKQDSEDMANKTVDKSKK